MKDEEEVAEVQAGRKRTTDGVIHLSCFVQLYYGLTTLQYMHTDIDAELFQAFSRTLNRRIKTMYI